MQTQACADPPRGPIGQLHLANDPPEVRPYKLAEAAELLGVCPDTARRMIRRGTFPVFVFRVGRHWRVHRADLNRYLGI